MTFEPVHKDTGQSGREDDDRSVSEERKVTLRNLAAYGFGLLAILGVVGSIAKPSVVAILLEGVAVYVSFPPARRQLNARYGVSVSTPAAAVIYFFTFTVGYIIISH
ncbi:hypothetical protein PNQ92_04245 [Halobacterium salinarum]|nr:hypothetical protein [Halobacterium salinarum]